MLQKNLRTRIGIGQFFECSARLNGLLEKTLLNIDDFEAYILHLQTIGKLKTLIDATLKTPNLKCKKVAANEK